MLIKWESTTLQIQKNGLKWSCDVTQWDSFGLNLKEAIATFHEGGEDSDNVIH